MGGVPHRNVGVALWLGAVYEGESNDALQNGAARRHLA
jgi:hypothetical protein